MSVRFDTLCFFRIKAAIGPDLAFSVKIVAARATLARFGDPFEKIPEFMKQFRAFIGKCGAIRLCENQRLFPLTHISAAGLW